VKIQRVTDFRIDTVDIDEAKFYRLSDEVQKLIRAYASFKVSPQKGYLRFEIPIYRWEEINGVMNVLKELDPVKKLSDSIEWVEKYHPLPRCIHGNALLDGAGDKLEPSCCFPMADPPLSEPTKEGE
jgi:hypothetical protein